ncbi:HAMP domain-containing histidine kinase [Candidatus Kaiserbacteria bacterium]|nr:HAMP domain-containing histidine kinase [Candidatus Kaiserbacteria bacterium]
MTAENPDDEQMLLVVHKHPVSFLSEAAVTIVPGFIILTLLFLFRGSALTMADASIHALITLLVPLCFLVLWTILAVQWTNYYLDMLIVTDRHIFYLTQLNFAQRSVEQWNIQDVSHVSAYFGNILESFFNYGSLEIDAREEGSPVKVVGIPDPEYVAAVILKQDDRYGQLKETAEKQQELLKFVSHEVKGHLAKSKAAFAAIVEGDFGTVSDPLTSMAHQALADSQKGVDTVMSILDDPGPKQSTIHFEKKPFDLAATVRRIVEEFRPQIERKGLLLQTSIDPFCGIQGDEQKIERHVIRNLLDNALHYTPAGHIEVMLQNIEGVARLCVADTGIGMNAGDIEKLFTQGGRGEHSKEVNPDSTGYGLFVAKQVVDAHGGRIWASSNGASTGSRFFAEFPLG